MLMVFKILWHIYYVINTEIGQICWEYDDFENWLLKNKYILISKKINKEINRIWMWWFYSFLFQVFSFQKKIKTEKKTN